MKRRMCNFENCVKEIDYKATGYCRTHHKQFINNKPMKPIKAKGTGRSICCVESCGRFVQRFEMCNSHYTQKQNGLSLTTVKHIAKSGEGCTSPAGYRILTIDGQKVFEHRYIMEQYLQRKLIKPETVHHKNGNRSDNRIENLELWSSNQPSGQRIIDKILWARQILDQYKYDLDLIITKPNDMNSK